MAEDKGLVCVTGATGFIASWLIMRLLQLGYSVRATVRSHPPGSVKKDLSFLTSLPTAVEKLKIFEADLQQPDSFTTVIEGCIGVFHVAHPIIISEQEPKDETIKMTVEGTLGILKACLNSKTVKRVVYTSSAATVLYSGKGQGLVDEETWSDINYYKTLNLRGTNLYMATKTKTEKAALEFAEKHGLDLVTVIPPFVVGPFICRHLPSSVRLALTMILGNNKDHYKYLSKKSMVHVDDLVSAHIFLFQSPNAKGSSLKDIEGYAEKGRLSSKKLLDSGFEYKYGLDEMFDGAIKSCKEKGFL
ncbi:hypothetical protein L484_025566 [Morus notabilis]|uniref:NAD-dependent epimerase/dehydratase domain-containing protein n=1 Tax=Morus notabilis TaxID=981085 RepID=W9RGQ9_9ROSA|nr:hypothetical protein L484_025566 [Morus notabilis]